MSRRPPRPTLLAKTIVLEIVTPLSIDPVAVFGRSLNTSFVQCRHLAMYVHVHGFGISTEQVGISFGRDHTSVMYACEKVEEMMARDTAVHEQLKAIRRAVRLKLLNAHGASTDVTATCARLREYLLTLSTRDPDAARATMIDLNARFSEGALLCESN